MGGGGGALLGGEQGIPVAMGSISSGLFPHSLNNSLSPLTQCCLNFMIRFSTINQYKKYNLMIGSTKITFFSKIISNITVFKCYTSVI